ncbi:hypothetical protein [Salinisphaera dokdonensis]|uniref:hypothetical protein n=1 Tax=Salinisphaera dokdonensis TaxID=454598 RepID=UPI00333ED963
MTDFIDPHHDVHGVRPICKVLSIASLACYNAKLRQADPGRRSARPQRDAQIVAIQQTCDANVCVYNHSRRDVRFPALTSFD